MPLGNDRKSWPDSLLGGIPNIYAYAANNPSESILAKRRGYGTLVSYNVPPYGRAGLYLDLANLKDLVSEYRAGSSESEKNSRSDLRDAIWASCERCDLLKDVPLSISLDEGEEASLVTDSKELAKVSDAVFDKWVVSVENYLLLLQDRLFSSGLHTLGSSPSDEELKSYLSAYYGDKLSDEECNNVVAEAHRKTEHNESISLTGKVFHFFHDLVKFFKISHQEDVRAGDSSISTDRESRLKEATDIAVLLMRNTDEIDNMINALSGGYVPAAPGGDLLRDGTSVLPTGRNIHALDPYRMPGAAAWARGQKAAEEILRQHREANNGEYPETVAVSLWGLDAIKTRG